MPFKIVSTVEDGKIMIVAIPQNWEKNGILYWPNLKGPLVEKERKNGNSMPQAGWSQQACKVKSYGLENYLEARNMEKTFSSLTDTEAEEKYEQKQRTKRKHPGYLKQQNEIPSVNHMFPKPNRKPSSEYAFCPDNELDSRSSIELPNEPLNNNNLSTQLRSFSIESNIDAGTESSVVLDLDQILLI